MCRGEFCPSGPAVGLGRSVSTSDSLEGASPRPANPFCALGNRWIHAIDFSHDDRWLAFSNKDGAVGLLDLLRGKFGPTLFTNVDCVWTVRLSPRNNDMLLGGDDGSVRLVKFHAMTALQSERTFTAPVASVAFPAPGDSVAVRLTDGVVQLRNRK